jgi:hypothetical protein
VCPSSGRLSSSQQICRFLAKLPCLLGCEPNPFTLCLHHVVVHTHPALASERKQSCLMLVSKWLQWPISEMAVESINQLRLFPAVAVSLFALNNCTLNAKCLRRHITTYRMRLHINLKYFRVTCAAVITVGIWQFQLYMIPKTFLLISQSVDCWVWAEFFG